jgi:drug/metabolite transporter (DMT)-like permease
MEWFIFALISTLLITLVNYGDKFLVESQVQNPLALLVLLSFMNGVFALIFWLLSGFMTLPLQSALLITLAGTAPVFAGYFYFQAVLRTEASHIIVMGQLSPVFTLILGILFLGEQLTGSQLLGFALIIAAALAVSIKAKNPDSPLSSASIWTVFGLMVMTHLIYSVAIVLTDELISDIVMQGQTVKWQALLSVTAHASLGYFLGGLALLAFVPPVRNAFLSQFKQTPLKAIFALSSVEAIFAIRMFIFYLALSLGPASLVTVVGSLNVFFAILFGWILTLWRPQIFKEDIRLKSLAQKAVWAALAFAGVLLIIEF